jgi:hypothetical protein
MRTLSIFKSQYIRSFLCKYSKPNTIPAKTILIPYYPSFLKASPLPLHRSKNDVRSPPSAIYIPEYIYLSHE